MRDLPPGNSGSKYNETKNWAKIAIIVAIGAIGFSAIAFAVLWSMANGINP